MKPGTEVPGHPSFMHHLSVFMSLPGLYASGVLDRAIQQEIDETILHKVPDEKPDLASKSGHPWQEVET